MNHQQAESVLSGLERYLKKSTIVEEELWNLLRALPSEDYAQIRKSVGAVDEEITRLQLVLMFSVTDIVKASAA